MAETPSPQAPAARAAPGLGDAELRSLRSYLADRFGPEAKAASVEPLSTKGGVKEGGYGVPYVVRWAARSGPRALVLETVRAGQFGHEDASDRAGILLRAYDDYATLERHVVPAGVGAFRAGRPATGLEELSEPFLLTEFAPGEPYANDFDRIAARGTLEDLDRLRVDALADYLAAIHSRPTSHPTWWRRRLRELVGSGECIAGIADSYPSPCGFITAKLLCEVETLALCWRYRLRDREERLRTIHGDFHPWNVLFAGGVDFRVLDRSRGPLGDPADDVASMSMNYLFYALRTAGAFEGPFAELFRRFWGRYAARAGDEGMAGAIAPHYAFRALVLANPIWYPREPESLRRMLFRFLLAALESERFDPDRIPEMLARATP